MKTRTPSIVDFSIFTAMRSSRPGRFLMVGSAPASAIGFHSSPVFGSKFQLLRSGMRDQLLHLRADVDLGIGRVFAGTSRPCASAGVESAMAASASNDVRA